MATTRTYRFRLTVEVDPDHEAYRDPEWIADAAHGTLTNLYGLYCTYDEIEEIDPPTGGSGA